MYYVIKMTFIYLPPAILILEDDINPLILTVIMVAQGNLLWDNTALNHMYNKNDILRHNWYRGTFETLEQAQICACLEAL